MLPLHNNTPNLPTASPNSEHRRDTMPPSAPDIHISEDKAGYIITVAAPDTTADALDIRLRDNMVSITGAAALTHSVRLPQPIDANATHAVLDSGILTLHIPKRNTPDTPRYIPVKSNPPSIETAHIDPSG